MPPRHPERYRIDDATLVLWYHCLALTILPMTALLRLIST